MNVADQIIKSLQDFIDNPDNVKTTSYSENFNGDIVRETSDDNEYTIEVVPDDIAAILKGDKM